MGLQRAEGPAHSVRIPAAPMSVLKHMALSLTNRMATALGSFWARASGWRAGGARVLVPTGRGPLSLQGVPPPPPRSDAVGIFLAAVEARTASPGRVCARDAVVVLGGRGGSWMRGGDGGEGPVTMKGPFPRGEGGMMWRGKGMRPRTAPPQVPTPSAHAPQVPAPDPPRPFHALPCLHYSQTPAPPPPHRVPRYVVAQLDPREAQEGGGALELLPGGQGEAGGPLRHKGDALLPGGVALQARAAAGGRGGCGRLGEAVQGPVQPFARGFVRLGSFGPGPAGGESPQAPRAAACQPPPPPRPRTTSPPGRKSPQRRGGSPRSAPARWAPAARGTAALATRAG
jgi:hypothetical protein